MIATARATAWIGILAIRLLQAAPAMAAPAAPTGVSLEDGRFVTGSSGQLVGFFTIDNKSGQDLQIVGWQSPACHGLSLQEAGATSDRKALDRMTIPARTRMVFAQGGYQLTCGGSEHHADIGTRIPVTASFRSGRTLTAPFTIRQQP